MRALRIGTRRSKLALIQANMYGSALEKAGYRTEIVEVESTGDRDRTSPLRDIKGRGVFSSELNERIVAGEIDLAVHSAKDLPTFLPEEVEIVGVLPRGSAGDVFVSDYTHSSIPPQSVVGTSSLRRRVEMLSRRQDLLIKDIRGNIETRIGKVESGDYDAVIIARAAVERLALQVKHEVLDLAYFPPAPNQGIIAATASPLSDGALAASKVSHEETMIHLRAEKTVLETLRFSCDDPVSVFSWRENGVHRLSVRIYSKIGQEYRDFHWSENVSRKAISEFSNEILASIPGSYGYK